MVFKSEENYLYFLEKVNTLIKPYADILAWCLMPNHFHFLLRVNAKACEPVEEDHRKNTQHLAKAFGLLLSSYTQGFNKQNKRRGSLFAHNTKAKCLNELAGDKDYGITCFKYIHQNPIEAGLCRDFSGWVYSSYLDYAGLRNGKLINKALACEMFPINLDCFDQQSMAMLDDDEVVKLY
jgi:REP element-mobilizing transposase RayT